MKTLKQIEYELMVKKARTDVWQDYGVIIDQNEVGA